MNDNTSHDDDMPTDESCKHVCSMADGNEYEFVVTTCSDSTTLFLCVPCFVGMATELIVAMTEPDNPDVQAAVAAYDANTVQTPGKRGKKAGLIGGVNTAPDFSMFDAYEPDVADLG
jgi:hypothetical protein